MNRIRFAFVTCLFAAIAAACTAPPVRSAPANIAVATPAKQMRVKNVPADAVGGIFDPSVVDDGSGKLWMSYSTVRPSAKHGKVFPQLGTRIAYSTNGGVDWTDADVTVAPPEEVKLPPPHNKFDAVWVNEVSSLAYDSYARPESRWKLVWHRYLRVYDGKSRDAPRLFEHGWISQRSAPSPTGPWSPERKLMVGKGYSDANNNTIGPPEMRLDRLFPGRDQLGRCLVYTEPSMLVQKDGIYTAFHCATGRSDGRIVLLRCDHEFQSCTYQGAFLEDDEAKRYGRDFDGFSATEMVSRGARTYLLVTPTRSPGSLYAGCLIFEIESLEKAKLKASDGKAAVVDKVNGDEGTFNGACGYIPGDVGGGVVFGQFWPDDQQQFRLFRSGKKLD